MLNILHKGITWGIFAVFRRDISSGCDWLFFIYRVQLLVIEHMYRGPGVYSHFMSSTSYISTGCDNEYTWDIFALIYKLYFISL